MNEAGRAGIPRVIRAVTEVEHLQASLSEKLVCYLDSLIHRLHRWLLKLKPFRLPPQRFEAFGLPGDEYKHREIDDVDWKKPEGLNSSNAG